jgi:hypothetical protein
MVYVALSEDARKLLSQVVALGEDYLERWVPDDILWEAAKFNPDTYYDAAEELYAKNLVEREGTDFALLRATSEGMNLARGG